MLEAIFRDEFDRTTASGLGTASDGTVYTPVGGADYAHVNGSYVLQTSPLHSLYTGLPRVAIGAVQFDFYTTSVVDDTGLHYKVPGGFELQSGGLYYPLFAQADPTGAGGIWTIACSNHSITPTLLASTWYTVRVEWDGTTERIKCWAKGTPEPGTWDASGAGALSGSGSTPVLEIFGPSNTARSARLDTIVIWRPFPLTPVFSDDFNRVVSPGLGGNWVWTADDSAQPSPGIMSVDGAYAHVLAGNWESQTNPDIPFAAQGYVRWDFLVPADTTDTAQMGFNFGAGTYYVGNPNATAHVHRAFHSNILGAYVEFFPAGSDWWTVWFRFGTGTDYVKVWPRDEPGAEPLWIAIPHTTGSTLPPDYAGFLLDVYNAPAAEDQLFDNLFVWVTGGTTTNFGSFSLAAEVLKRSFDLSAVVKSSPRAVFDLEAIVARGWRFEAWVLPLRQFDLAAIALRGQSGSFPVAAEIATERPKTFTLDAFAALRHAGSFGLKAWIVPVPVQFHGFDLTAFVVGTPGSFTLDAQVSSPVGHAGGFALEADVSATYRQAAFSVAAVVAAAQRGVFDLEAIVVASSTLRSSSFDLGARIAGRILLEAFVGYSFSLAAEVRNPAWEFTLDAAVAARRFGWWTFNAMIANGSFSLSAIVKATRSDEISLIASVVRRTAGSFELDARVAGGFALEAYVQPWFRLEAEIASSLGQKYWPPGSGNPGNPGPVDGGTGAPWGPPHHQVRIEILIDDVDVTKDVEIAGCNFTQAAGNNPGTFSLPMKGVFTKYDGGEEVIVKIDGFRQFGGIVVTANHGFHFAELAGDPTDPLNEQPMTLLQGADFNVLFDRVMVYNVPWVVAHGAQGDYEPIDPLPKDETDRFYIQTVFGKYIDRVWRKQFGFATYVEEATAHPSPETPFTVETGQTLRVFLAALSQVTNQIWYLDPYYELHSHSRANANAPRAITDGTGSDSGGDLTGGIHCRDLTVVWSIGDMADETFVYGTLAETVAGEIIVNRRRDEENIAKFGLWQYSEVRSDLHLAAHVSQRGYALQVRSDRRIHRAQCRVFEKGFQAGQIVSLFSGEYGVAENIPITQLTMTFLASQGAEDGKYYGIPAYDLTMSNEPDPPWNLYDALPWQTHDFNYGFDVPRFRMPHLQLRNSGPGPQIALCRGDGWTTVWSGCDAIEVDHLLTKTVTTKPLSPPPWCIVVRLPAGNPAFSLGQGMINTDNSGYFGKTSFAVSLAGSGANWTLGLTTFGQDENAGGGGAATGAVTILSDRETYVRIQCLQDGTLNGRVWQHGSHEPSGWTAVARTNLAADVSSLFDGGLQPSSRLQFDGPPAAEFAIAGLSGWGWIWFEPLRTNLANAWIKTYDPYPPATWNTWFYPGGSRPYEVPGASGNTIDAEVGAGGTFPRSDGWGAFNGGVFGSETILDRLIWGFSFVSSNASGDPNDPRMLTEVRNYVGFRAPPGATRVEIDATAYANVYETGIAGVGSQPGPTGEGAIAFEIWRADYRGQPSTSDPNHDVLFSGVAPDYTYKDGDGGPITYAYPFHVSLPINGDETIQLGGKITNSWDELMHSHHEGPLLVNGLKRVLELKLTNIRMRFFWDPVPCGEDDLLGDCFDPADDPYWETGWGQETTAADRSTGAFVARLPVAPATLSVYRNGRLLLPDDDYTADGDADHRDYRLVVPGAKCLRLVYLANTASITTEINQPGPGTGNKIPDRTNQSDTRGIGR